MYSILSCFSISCSNDHVFPLLTAVAYLHCHFIPFDFGVAPIYKFLIRKVLSSKLEQNHLIEVLGGIQTVKAQHSDLLLVGNGRIVTIFGQRFKALPWDHHLEKSAIFKSGQLLVGSVDQYVPCSSR